MKISMHKLLSFIWIFLFATGMSSAQQSGAGSLQGKITDEETGEALFSAYVRVVGTYDAAVTDENGFYRIDGIKAGDYSIRVTYIGYSEKLFTGIRINERQVKTLNVKLTPQNKTFNTITVVGEKNLIDLDNGESSISIRSKDIEQMNVRDVKEVVATQPGITQSPDGIHVRGSRVYETQYLIDNISARDPLAGTGYGVNVSASSIGNLTLITGGAGAEFGDGSSGVISTEIKEGGDKHEFSGSWQRDHINGNNPLGGWNTDIAEFSMAGPVPFTKKKMSYFQNLTLNLSDDYFGPTANQLHSSLFPANDSFWAPRYNNNYTHTLKLAYNFNPSTKLTLTNQHSLTINQNTRTLQIIGFNAILQPGFQFERSLNLDNATTYTSHSNLTALNLKHAFNEKLVLNLAIGRLFTNLRADANGRPFRTETVDREFDEFSIVTDPVSVFNPGDSILFVLPGPGLVNNGGISPVWHDHYAREYTFKASFRYYPSSEVHKFSFGWEHKANAYQWVDVSRPWVGAPIRINDTLSTANISIGSSNDIWSVKPNNGGFFFTDEISYKGIVASLGLRLNYWAPGRFADDAVGNPQSPVLEQIRKDYEENTLGFLGLRYKMRLLPRVNVSFPVTSNNTLYFNYGHSMQLPHPRFVYAGLDPEFQSRSFLSNLGNPDLNPEINVSYEVGWKSQISKDLALSLTAYNNNRFDYIVSRRVITTDATGRPVSKVMYINQDYARILGAETSVQYRLSKSFRLFGNVGYMSARGKSNSARESLLQIEQNGEVALSREQYLAWDRPWNINLGVMWRYDSSMKYSKSWMKGMQLYLSSSFQSGFRYTPQIQEGTNDLGRPLYRPDLDRFLEERATPWFNTDLKISKTFRFHSKTEKGITLSIEARNLFNNLNAQIINPVTGRAWEAGDDVPDGWRDPRYVGPEERGTPPNDPARYLASRQILGGLMFRF